MFGPGTNSSRVRVIVAVVLTAVIFGCESNDPVVVDDALVMLAKGGSKGPPKVKEAIPPWGEQETTLDVRVLGSGFDHGSVATFTLNGTPTAKVRTNSTAFIGGTELLANVTISVDAVIDLYDVEVMTKRGKKGIGADLFRVVAKSSGGKPAGDPPIAVLFTEAEEHNIRGDGRGTYENGCNVSAKFNLEDAILNLLGGIKKKDQAACGDPRSIHVQFPDVAVEDSPDSKKGWFREMFFMNVDHVENVTQAEGTVLRKATFGYMGCALGLKFDPAQSTADFTVNDVEVTWVGDNRWTVRTQAFPNNVAVCIPSGGDVEREYYRMAFEITVGLRGG